MKGDIDRNTIIVGDFHTALMSMKIKIISVMFSDHNGMKLELNHRKKNGGAVGITWRLNNMLLKNQGSLVTQSIMTLLAKWETWFRCLS